MIPLTKYSKTELFKIKNQVEQYRQFRKARTEIVYYFKLLLEELNKLEQSLLLGVPAKKGEKGGQKKEGH